MNTRIKPRYDKIKALSVDITASAAGVSEGYVRRIISGERDEPVIKRRYDEVYSAFQQVVNKYKTIAI